MVINIIHTGRKIGILSVIRDHRNKGHLHLQIYVRTNGLRWQLPGSRGFEAIANKAIRLATKIHLLHHVISVYVISFTAQVLKVCRSPGPTACSKTLDTKTLVT